MTGNTKTEEVDQAFVDAAIERLMGQLYINSKKGIDFSYRDRNRIMRIYNAFKKKHKSSKHLLNEIKDIVNESRLDFLISMKEINPNLITEGSIYFTHFITPLGLK